MAQGLRPTRAGLGLLQSLLCSRSPIHGLGQACRGCGRGCREEGPGEDTPSTEWGAPETEMKREGFPMDWSSLWEDSSAGVPAISADNPPQNPPPQVGRDFLGDAAQRWGLFPGPDGTEWGSGEPQTPAPRPLPGSLTPAHSHRE